MENLFNFDILGTILVPAVAGLICITVHELSHGFVAYKMGDNTAKDAGRLTLNPIKHIDIIGLVMIIFVGFGWAKPVPVDMTKFKHPKWQMAVTAIAGPASNLLLAVIVSLVFMALPYPYGGYMSFVDFLSPWGAELPIVTQIVCRLVYINVFLAMFNLLPIPPLDGSKVLFSVLPKKAYYKLMHYEKYGMILLMVLVLGGNFLGFNLFGFLIDLPASAVLIGILDFAHSVVSYF